YFISVADGRIWVGNDPGSLTNNYGYHPVHRLEPGETEWTRSADSGFPGSALSSAANGLAHDPSSGVYYVASALGGMYTSTDRTNWQRRTEGLGTGMVFGFSVFAKNGVALLNLTGGGTYRSTDNGVTWSQAAGITSTSEFIDTGSRIIAANAGTVFITSDQGENWDGVSGLVANAPIDLTSDGNTVFATQGFNYLTSTIMMNYSSTHGATWGVIPSTGLPSNFVPVRIIPHGGHLYAFGSVGPTGPSALYRVAISSLSLPPIFGIASHPKSLTALAGQDISLRVVAGGVEPLTYQWKRDGENIAGETSSSLVIEDSATTNSGSYTVVVTDTNGATATSNPAVVNLLLKDHGRVDPLMVRGSLNNGNDHGTLYSMPDGSVVAVRNNYAMRVGPDGDRVNIRSNFGSSSNSDYPVHLLDSQGRIVLFPKSSPNSSYKYIRRLQGTGNFANDGTFSYDSLVPTAGSASRVVSSACELPGQGYLVAGNFTEIGSHAVNRLALISYDGTTVTQFGTPPASGSLSGVHYSAADQSIWVTGDFNNWPGESSQSARIVKLTSSGAVAPGWNPYVFSPASIPATSLQVLLVQSDGKVIVRRAATSSVQNILRRLNPDGSFDTTFNVAGLEFTGGASAATIFTRAVEMPGGGIAIAGDFTAYGAATCAKYCVLLADGTLDGSFYCASGYNNGTSAIQSLAYDPRGYLYLSNGLQTTSTGASFQGIGPVGRSVVRVFAPLPSSGAVSYEGWAAALPEGQRDMNDDADNDGFANVFDFLYGGSPTAPDALGAVITPASAVKTAAEIHLSEPAAGLETGKTYQTVTFRIPKDLKGFAALPQAAGENLDFDD
ncbi:MAG: hypothetical protein EOP85_04930, partial [Verrucomicrobiaceae bacterium]